MNKFDSDIQTYISTNNANKGIDSLYDLSYEAIDNMISRIDLVAYCSKSEYFNSLVKLVKSQTNHVSSIDSIDDESVKIQLYELYALMVYVKGTVLFKTEDGRRIATHYLIHVLRSFCEFRYGKYTIYTVQFIKEIERKSNEEIDMMSPCQIVSRTNQYQSMTTKIALE